jgi:hypothetical protein
MNATSRPEAARQNLERNYTKPPWWSEADEAELDVLVDVLVGVVWRHKSGCLVCTFEGQLCDPAREALRRAVEVIEDWKRKRALRSRAAWLADRETDRLGVLRIAARGALHGDEESA